MHHRRLRQRHDQIEIMDHQIDGDRDIQIAGRAQAHAAGGYAARGLGNIKHTHGLEDKTLLVADLEDEIALAGNRDQLVSAYRSIGQGLFGEHVPASLQGGLHTGIMVHGRTGDGDGVAIGDQRVEIGIGAGVQLGGERTGAFPVGIIDTGEVDAVRGGIFARMVSAENAGTDDACLHPGVVNAHGR